MPTINKITRPSWMDKKVGNNQHTRTSDPYHHTTAWRKLRKLKLSINPLCEHCEAIGINTTAKVVDHIRPIEQGGSKTDRNNLQSLCVPCDNRKAGEDSHKYKTKHKQ